jgi:hypothetical protein
LLLGDWAPAAAEILGIKVPKNWSTIAEKIRIPYEEDENILLEYEGMDGTVHIKQASVTLINYPLGWNLNERQAQNDMTFVRILFIILYQSSPISCLRGVADAW